MALMSPQLWIRAFVAPGVAWTTIWRGSEDRSQGVELEPDSHHLTRMYLRDDCLHRPTIVQTFEVHKQEPTRQLHLHGRGDELRGRFSWDVLEAESGLW